MIVGGTLGSLAGATLWFVAGWVFNLERLRRLGRKRGPWLTVGPTDIDQTRA